MVFQQKPFRKSRFRLLTDWSGRPVLTNGKRPWTLLRTTSNIALACLATTDAKMGVIGQPLFTAGMTAHLQGDNSLGQKLLFRFTMRLLTVLSLLHLVMINVERYIAIKPSLQYTTIVTEVRLICSSAFLWIITLLSALPVAFTDISSIQKINSVSIALFLAIIVFCQVVLYRETRRHEKEIAN